MDEDPDSLQSVRVKEVLFCFILHNVSGEVVLVLAVTCTIKADLRPLFLPCSLFITYSSDVISFSCIANQVYH